MTPQRIQRRRVKGWRMPEGAVYVGRGSKWGNPFPVGEEIAVALYRPRIRVPVMHGYVRARDRADAVEYLRLLIDPAPPFHQPGYPTVREIRAELAGKDLACWCPVDEPCHADLLLEIANGEDDS